jgi:outer membrane receptor protein involved in Fe transport
MPSVNIRFFKHLASMLVFLLISCSLVIQGQTRISGFVRDKNTGERLIGANVLLTGTQTGTVTDNNGYFSLVSTIPCSVNFSYVGYTSRLLDILSRRDTLIEVGLEPGKQLGTVEVRGIRAPRANVASLRISELQQMPSLGAKPDILKSMQLLPGIQSQNEGTSRLLVRGGDPGQNLYLFDNVPIIYVNHLGGFMSVFNPDIINSIDIYKGGFPARFGGRLS